MVTIAPLWMPILIAAVLCWLAASVIWMVMPHHKSDYKKVGDEEAVRAALRGLSPGLYNIPYCVDRKEIENPEVKRKFEEGPLAFVTIVPSGVPAMGKYLVLQFLYYLIVGVFVAYVAGRTLAPGTDYLHVFQITGAVAWMAYGFADIPESIWFGRPWSITLKYLADALVFALLTAGVFGWLWPALS